MSRKTLAKRRAWAARFVPIAHLVRMATEILAHRGTAHGTWYIADDPCYLCGCTYVRMGLDHVTPRQHVAPGASTMRENGARVCRYCQAKKGHSDLLQYLALRALTRRGPRVRSAQR